MCSRASSLSIRKWQGDRLLSGTNDQICSIKYIGSKVSDTGDK